jgi:NAD(P)-dependent dehydrogenase (short-subunit alcohol dehydrogenase family)
MDAFRDRIALVTGASRGLGHAVARALGAAGAHVVALARTVGGLEELDDAIRAAARESGGAATLVPLDVTDDPGLERLGAALYERWGRLDIWAHAAIHASPLSPVGHIDAKDFDRALAVNLRATQRLVRVLDPLLRQSPRGRAVFFTDETGPAAGAGQRFHAAYRASKQGQIEIAAAWAREVEATPGLRVVFAAPPPMPTALRLRFYPGEPRDRLADPAAVADALLTGLAGEGTRLDLRPAPIAPHDVMPRLDRGILQPRGDRPVEPGDDDSRF